MPFIYSIPPNHCVIIERGGKFSSLQREGLNFKIPFRDSIKYLDKWQGQAVKDKYLIELGEQRFDTPSGPYRTKDQENIQAKASVFWKIIDPVKAAYKVDDLPQFLATMAWNKLKEVLGIFTLHHLLTESQDLAEYISGTLVKKATDLGIKLIRVEILELKQSPMQAGYPFR
jgi:regulator of protease activity HflC (stomatin/prohibitin superfamily)